MEDAPRPRPLAQKTIGILGGCSNVATGIYYQLINEISNRRLGGWDMAETVIVGMNFGNIEHMLRTEDWSGLKAYMADKVDRLVAARADLIIVASNTLHRPMADIVEGRDVEWLHIADPTGRAIRAAGLRRILLLGTQAVMQLDYLKQHYADRFGLEILVPADEEREEIDRIIFDELVKDRIEPTSKARYLEIADRMVREDGVQGLIMGCTEICSLIQQPDRPDLPMFDTTRLHCEAAVDAVLGDLG
ncbi:MAG: amino acid racemase [Acidobacteriota bacterium]